MSDPQVISMLYEVLVAQSKYESRGLEHRSRLKANYHRLVRENSAHRDLNRKFPKQQVNKMLVSLADSVGVLDATELQPTDLELCYGINQYVFPKIPDFNGLDSKYLSKWHKFYGLLPAHHRFPGSKKRQNEKKPFPMSKRRNVRDSDSSSESDTSGTKSPVPVLLTEDDFDDPNEHVKTEDPYEPVAPAFKREEEPVYSEFPEPDEGHVRLPIVMNKEVEFSEDSIVFGLMEDDKLGEWVSTSSFETYRQLYRQIYFYDPSLKINPAFKHEIEPPMTEEEARKLKEKEKDKDSQKKVKDENANVNVNINANMNENKAENKNINESSNLNENNDPNCDPNKDDNQSEEQNGDESQNQKNNQEVVVDRPKSGKRGKSPFKSERAPVSASKVDSSKCYRSDLRGKISIRERKNELEELQDAGLHAVEEQQAEGVEADSHTDSSEDADATDALIGARNFYRKSKFMKLPGEFKQNTEHFDPAAIFGNYYCPTATPPDSQERPDSPHSSDANTGVAKHRKKSQTPSSTTLVDSQERPDTPHSSDSPNFLSLRTATVNFMEVDSVYSCDELGNFEVRCSAKYRIPFGSGVRRGRPEGALGVYQELQALLKQLFALKRRVSGNCSLCSGWNLLHGIAQSFCEFCEDKLADSEPELLLRLFEIRRYIVSVLYPIVGYKYQVLELFGSGELAENWRQLLGAQRVSIQALTQVGASFPKASLHDARYLPSPVALPRSICDAINSFQFPKTNQPEAGGAQAREECATPINTPTKRSPFIASVSSTSSSLRGSSASSGELYGAEPAGARPPSDKRLQSYGLMELVNYRRYHRAKMLNDFLEQLYKAYHSRSASRRSPHLVNNYVNILKNGHMLTTEFVLPENASFDLDSDEAESSDSECVDPKRPKEAPKAKEASKSKEASKAKDSAKPKCAPRSKEIYYDEDASFVLTRLPLDTDMIKLSFYHRGVFQCKTGALRTYAFAQVARMFGFKEGQHLAEAAEARQQEFERLASLLSCSDASDSSSLNCESLMNCESLQSLQSIESVRNVQSLQNLQNIQNAQNNQNNQNTQNVHESLQNIQNSHENTQNEYERVAVKTEPELGAQTPYATAAQLVKSEPADQDRHANAASTWSGSEATHDSRPKSSPRRKTRAKRAPKPQKPEPAKKTRKERKNSKGDAKPGHKTRGRPRLEPKPDAEPKPKPRGRGRRKAEPKKPKPDARPEEGPEPAEPESPDGPAAPPSARSLDERLLGFSYNWHECLVRHLNKRSFLVTGDAASCRDLVERLLAPECASDASAPARDRPLLQKLHRYRLLENMPTQVLTALYNTGKVKIGFPTSLEMYILGLPDALMDRSMYGGVGKGFMYSLDAIVHNLALLSTLIRIGGTVTTKRKRSAK